MNTESKKTKFENIASLALSSMIFFSGVYLGSHTHGREFKDGSLLAWGLSGILHVVVKTAVNKYEDN